MITITQQVQAMFCKKDQLETKKIFFLD